MRSFPYLTKTAAAAIEAARQQLEAGQTVTLTIRTHAALGLKTRLDGEPIVRSGNAYGASVGAALERLIPGLDCRCDENNSAFIHRAVALAGYRLTADPNGFHVRKAAASEAALAELRAAHEAEVRASAALLAHPIDKSLYRAWSEANDAAQLALAALEGNAAELKAA